jgi:hypothetical protein
MRWKMLCALAIVAGAAWGSEVRADEPAPGGNWFSRWFKFGKTSGKNDFDSAAVQPMPSPAVDARTRAEAALHRRLAVCLELQKIALETKDDDLYQQAEQLANEAGQRFLEAIYRQPGQ